MWPCIGLLYCLYWGWYIVAMTTKWNWLHFISRRISFSRSSHLTTLGSRSMTRFFLLSSLMTSQNRQLDCFSSFKMNCTSALSYSYWIHWRLFLKKTVWCTNIHIHSVPFAYCFVEPLLRNRAKKLYHRLWTWPKAVRWGKHGKKDWSTNRSFN